MPMLLAMALGKVWRWVLAASIFKLVTALGIGFVVFQGAQELIAAGFASVQAQFGGLSAQVLSVFRMLRVDDAIAVIASAISIRLAIRTVGSVSGSIRKLGAGHTGE